MTDLEKLAQQLHPSINTCSLMLARSDKSWASDSLKALASLPPSGISLSAIKHSLDVVDLALRGLRAEPARQFAHIRELEIVRHDLRALWDATDNVLAQRDIGSLDPLVRNSIDGYWVVPGYGGIEPNDAASLERTESRTLQKHRFFAFEYNQRDQALAYVRTAKDRYAQEVASARTNPAITWPNSDYYGWPRRQELRDSLGFKPFDRRFSSPALESTAAWKFLDSLGQKLERECRKPYSAAFPYADQVLYVVNVAKDKLASHSQDALAKLTERDLVWLVKAEMKSRAQKQALYGYGYPRLAVLFADIKAEAALAAIQTSSAETRRFNIQKLQSIRDVEDFSPTAVIRLAQDSQHIQRTPDNLARWVILNVAATHDQLERPSMKPEASLQL